MLSSCKLHKNYKNKETVGHTAVAAARDGENQAGGETRTQIAAEGYRRHLQQDHSRQSNKDITITAYIVKVDDHMRSR